MVSNHVSEDDRCFLCGEDNINVLQSHHIVPSVFGGSDEEHNRVVLCANHHQAIHAIYSDPVFKRLGVPKVNGEMDDADDLDFDSFSDLTATEQFEHLQRQMTEDSLKAALESAYRELNPPDYSADTHIPDESDEEVSRRQVIKLVRSAIRELNEDSTTDDASLMDIYQYCDDRVDVSFTRVCEEVIALYAKGEIYTPARLTFRYV